ncbi:tetratricopeptide repeat protein, partial [Micromonospora echinofusca]|nr:serine/threonine protein kinase [Micromonospora echinofusca]
VAPHHRAVPPQPAPGGPSTGLRAAINDAWTHSNDLLAEERYTQAAEALKQVIEPAAAALGVESPRVLALRQRRAAILVIGGDFRQALPEFDALYSAFARTGGPTSDDALACLRQAAHCRAELGQATVALRQFRQVLDHIRAAEGDVSSEALELRRNIAMLLLAEGNIDQAVAELVPLHEDLALVYGPHHEETREIADVLTRLRRASGRSG